MSRFFIVRHDFQNDDIYLCEAIEDTLQEAKDYCQMLYDDEQTGEDNSQHLQWVERGGISSPSDVGFSDAEAVCMIGQQAFAIFEREV